MGACLHHDARSLMSRGAVEGPAQHVGSSVGMLVLDEFWLLVQFFMQDVAGYRPEAVTGDLLCASGVRSSAVRVPYAMASLRGLARCLINIPSSSEHMLQIGFGYEPMSFLVRVSKTHQDIKHKQDTKSES